MDIMEALNSPGMWAACSLMVIMAMIQAFMFMSRSMKAAKEMGFNQEQINKAIRAGTIAAIGPSCAIGVGVVGMMATVGNPVAWLRLSVIGSLSYELRNVSLVGDAFGMEIGSFTPEIMVAAIWVLGLAGCFYQLNVICLAPSYDKVLKKVTNGNPRILNIIMSACTVGIYSRSTAGYFLKIAKSPANAWACLAGAAASGIITQIIVKRMKVKWLTEWSLPISMIVGMAAAVMLK